MKDGDSGLYYMGARYYDSVTGRFVSRDPIKDIDPISINPYQYAEGNPMMFVDTTGRKPETNTGTAPVRTVPVTVGEVGRTGVSVFSEAVGQTADRVLKKIDGVGKVLPKGSNALKKLKGIEKRISGASTALSVVEKAAQIKGAFDAMLEARKKVKEVLKRAESQDILTAFAYDVAVAELNYALKTKRITSKQWERLLRNLSEGYTMQLDSSRTHRFMTALLENLRGALKAFGGLTPVQGEQWDRYFNYLEGY
jgi:RHS repeat-associated protein